MTFTSTPITVKDSAAADKSIIAYNDGTSSAFAHPLLDNTGTIISPATAANQTTGNSSLATIATNTAGLATASSQTTANSSLATIATNTTGLATASSQTTANSSLATIATNTAGLATASSQTTGNSSLATIATNTAGLATSSNQTSANGKFDTIIANTGAGSVSLSITPTVTAGAYTTGMVAGGKLTLTGAGRASGGSGIIQYVSVTKKTALTAPYDVYFFQTDPTNSTFTDNAALALNVADLPYLVGVVHCTDLVDNGTPKTLQAGSLALPFKLATGTSLFAVAVIRGGETLSSTSALVVNVGILQD